MSERRTERITKVITPNPDCIKGHQPQNAIPPDQRTPPGSNTGVGRTTSADTTSTTPQANTQQSQQG